MRVCLYFELRVSSEHKENTSRIVCLRAFVMSSFLVFVIWYFRKSAGVANL